MWVIAVCWIAWPRQTENVVAAFLSIVGSTAFFTGLGQAWLWLIDPTSQYAIAGPGVDSEGQPRLIWACASCHNETNKQAYWRAKAGDGQ
jgi:hypothetical protein